MKKLAALAIGVFIGTGSAIAVSQTHPEPLQPTGGHGLTEVHGIKVGHHTLSERPTGCTVILVDGEGVPGSVAQRGGAPATRETDLLGPSNLVDRVNAIVLSGGSAYGLDAATGTMKWLEERKIGWPVGAAGVVPIVPAASLIDLWFGGKPGVRPTAECGYKAAGEASTGAVQEGNIGAGAGATVGKMATMSARSGLPAGQRHPMKGGLGSAAIRLPTGLVVGAIVAVNSVGDVIDPESGHVIAGARSEDGKHMVDIRKQLRTTDFGTRPAPRAGENTTIAVVATNAALTKAELQRIAMMADDGIARAVYPAHTPADGDTVFALATGRWRGNPNIIQIGQLAADALAEAIVRAVSKAESLAGVPSARELGSVPARIK